LSNASNRMSCAGISLSYVGDLLYVMGRHTMPTQIIYPTLIGQTVLHYRVTAKLGEGGMGEVYRATDTRLGREVAIKVLPASFAANVESMARFAREAQVLASLNHSGIASVFGLEESNGLRGLVMELVEGPTLADRLRSGPIPLDEALHIAEQVAEALEYAHERGIIHRDLKPANVKVTADGTVKLLDFGLAKAIEGDSTAADISSSPTISMAATQAGIILGTAAYMSPEQARGKPVDRRADIWALGILLFELLTGKALYSGETTSDILACVIEREPDLSQLPANTPAPIRELIRRCLTKNPRQRLRDIGDARLALEEYLTNPSAAQPGVETAVPAPHHGRSALVVWLLGGVVLGALVAGAVIWKLRAAAPAQPMMHFSAVTNFTGIDAQPSFSPYGLSVAFLSNRGGQLDIWVGQVTGGSPVRITNDPNVKARPHWSPDGSKIAYARLNESGLWDIWTVPALGGSPRKLLNNAADAAWSPEGGSLAYTNNSTGTIWTCDSMGGDARALTELDPRTLHIEPAYSHDGRRIVFVRKGSGPYSELAWIDLSSRHVQYITDDKALTLSPVWSADNEFVYFSSSRGGTMNLWKVAAQGGTPVQITAGRGDDAELDLSADGRKIIFASHRSGINLQEVALDSATENGRKWLTTDASRGTLSPAYSPDGRRISYFTNRKGAEHESIWIMDGDGSNPVKMVEDSYINVFPRWSSDGQSLMFTSRHRGIEAPRILRRLSLSGTVPEELPLVLVEAGWGDVAPDGRIVFRASSGQVQVFDPRDKKTQTMNSVRGGFFTWSRDGQHLATIVSAQQVGDKDAGVWVYDLNGGVPQQLFRGWVAAYAWAGADELFVVEGKPDLSAVLWRVRLDGSRPVRTPTTLQLRFSLPELGAAAGTGYARFDVHPDRKRIVVEAFRFQESDITMIENIR
jgi:eukaryotic-like serine/threonine-protein kinase